MNEGSVLPFDLSEGGQPVPQGPTKPNQMGKLYTSKFKQGVSSQSLTNYIQVCLSTSKVENPQRKTWILNSWAKVPPAQWPTVIPETDRIHKSQMYHKHESNGADAHICSTHLLILSHLKLNNWTVLFVRNTETQGFPSICIHYQVLQGSWLPVFSLSTAYLQYGLWTYTACAVIIIGSTDWWMQIEGGKKHCLQQSF